MIQRGVHGLHWNHPGYKRANRSGKKFEIWNVLWENLHLVGSDPEVQPSLTWPNFGSSGYKPSWYKNRVHWDLFSRVIVWTWLSIHLIQIITFACWCRDFWHLLPSRYQSDWQKKSTSYLLQSILMAIQPGNAFCAMGCQKSTSTGLEGLFNFHV